VVFLLQEDSSSHKKKILKFCWDQELIDSLKDQSTSSCNIWKAAQARPKRL